MYKTLNMKILGIFSLFIGIISGTDPIVRIDQGELQGISLKSRNGRDFLAFQKIPYAKPPINELRFEAPVPAEPWVGILNATTEPPMCIQKNLFMYQTSKDLLGVEDCLYLNVYTPQIPKKGKTLLPVMVWIPGGGFSSGHGGMSLYGPHYLLDKNVVVVSLNYRVGTLGFLSTEDSILPGNYGMKDQVLALKWVNKYINKFGGDPKKVTIFGESAGGASVGLHLLSPMSKGLFHKAILQSGTPLCRWAVIPPGLAKRRHLALSTIAGCPTESNQMVDCLKRLPAELLVDLHNNIFEWNIYPTILFAPVVEECNKEAFLCNYPLTKYVQISNVPVLIGMNSGEGGIFAARMYTKESKIADLQLQNNFDYYISSMLNLKYTMNYSDIPVVGKKIYDHYFLNGSMSDPLNAVKMVTGGIFLQGVLDMATRLSSTSYFYIFDHVNEMTFNSFYGPCPKKLGVTHGDEMISLFKINTEAELKGEDLKISELMVNLWTRFAYGEKLTVDGRNKGAIWPTIDVKNKKYVLINSSGPVVSEEPYKEDYEFWNSLPVLSSYNTKVLTEKIVKTEL